VIALGLVVAVVLALVVLLSVVFDDQQVASSPTADDPEVNTLRVTMPGQVPSLDPALARPLSYATWHATCGTLTAFRDTAAPDGLRTRPEAAEGSPVVSRDGRTYVFKVRRGLRFSDGSPLMAANFARALERVRDPAMRAYAARLFADVKRVDANGRSLRIVLRQPGGDLTTRLALPWACPVPRGFPVDPAGVALMVGSGPYYVARRVPNRLLVLERNPYYRGRRPHHVKRVVMTVGGDILSNIRQVERGRADAVASSIGRDVRDRMAQRYGVNKEQLFRIMGLYTGALVFNTTRPLFRDNVALRKAVNYAVDRTEIGRAGGCWAYCFAATDQILPRGIPGWTDHHLYPLERPDLRRARALADGHLRGGRAILYTCTGRSLYARYTCVGLVDQSKVIVENLRAIGLEVEVRVLDAEALLKRAGVPGEPYDMVLADFGWDYPDPANMLVPLLAGENARKRSGNSNLAYFDERRYNRKLAAAGRLSGAARFRAFSRLDAEIMRNQAPWAPLFEGSAENFVSERVGCLKVHPVLFRDYAAMCFR
jgi:peptide/nickel transport system substrate-binding protein